MKQFIKDILKQLLGSSEPRTGKLVFTQKVKMVKMPEYGISEDTLKLTFEYGRQTNRGNGVYQVVRQYKYYSVGLWYVKEWRPVKYSRKVDQVCVVITCWKGKVR